MHPNLPLQVDTSNPPPHTLGSDTVEQLGTIGGFARSCVFFASVSDASLSSLTGLIDGSMLVFGHRPAQPGTRLLPRDLPRFKQQVAAALAGDAPIAYEYRYRGAAKGNGAGVRCLLKKVAVRDLPAGIGAPAVIGVAHQLSDSTAPDRLAEARLFADLFERWMCAAADLRPIVEEAIRTSAEAMQVVSSNGQCDATSLLSDQAAVELRLASEIHDGICQQLAAAAGILSAVTTAVDAGDVVRARTKLDMAQCLVDEAMVESRRTISGLQPPALDGVALPLALRRLAEQAVPAAAIYVEIDEAVRLPGPASREVYRIAQEALANVRKHAGAQLVEIALLDLGSEVQLLVRDDGCGFACDEGSRDETAFGLRSMRGRALALGARLDLASSPGAGTCLDLRTPKIAS